MHRSCTPSRLTCPTKDALEADSSRPSSSREPFVKIVSTASSSSTAAGSVCNATEPVGAWAEMPLGVERPTTEGTGRPPCGDHALCPRDECSCVSRVELDHQYLVSHHLDLERQLAFLVA